MGKVKDNILFSRSSGKIGDVIYKKYSYGTVISKIPDRTICFTRSRQMLEACLKIYFWGNNASAGTELLAA
jgi:hypothetical protein